MPSGVYVQCCHQRRLPPAAPGRRRGLPVSGPVGRREPRRCGCGNIAPLPPRGMSRRRSLDVCIARPKASVRKLLVGFPKFPKHPYFAPREKRYLYQTPCPRKLRNVPIHTVYITSGEHRWATLSRPPVDSPHPQPLVQPSQPFKVTHGSVLPRRRSFDPNLQPILPSLYYTCNQTPSNKPTPAAPLS